MVSKTPGYEIRNRKSGKIYLAARKVLPSPNKGGNSTDFCKPKDDTSFRPSIFAFDFFFLFLELAGAAIVDNGTAGNA